MKKLQYLADHEGNLIGVFIPIQEWESIRKTLHLPVEPKAPHRQKLLEAFDHVKQIREGKIPKPNLKDVLNEI